MTPQSVELKDYALLAGIEDEETSEVLQSGRSEFLWTLLIAKAASDVLWVEKIRRRHAERLLPLQCCKLMELESVY